MWLVLLYLSAIVLANLSVAYFGPAISVLNSFLFIGLDLTTRDALHERWHGRVLPMLCLILTGGAISYMLNSSAGIIAVASTVAFILSALTDYGIYKVLEGRTRWIKVNSSNIGGAAVDSIVFPTIAFGTFLPLVVLGQFAAKVLGGVFWYGVLHAVFVGRSKGRPRRYDNASYEADT